MKPGRFALILLLLGPVLSLAYAAEQQLFIGYRYEAGVESKLLGTLRASFAPHHRIRIEAGTSFSAFDHPGFSRLGLTAGIYATDFWQAQVQIGLQHEQWNDWLVGENRAIFLLDVRPHHRALFGLGIAYRAPVFSTVRYWLPWWFSSDAPEVNFLYRARWDFIELGRFSASAELANVNLMELHNPQQFPVELSGSWRIASDLSFVCRCRTAMTGLSGLLISFPEITAELGVRHGF
ncbi:MAG: hypothetical protein ABIL25_08275 [candidate division WOR-3 bacterium]